MFVTSVFLFKRSVFLLEVEFKKKNKRVKSWTVERVQNQFLCSLLPWRPAGASSERFVAVVTSGSIIGAFCYRGDQREHLRSVLLPW